MPKKRKVRNEIAEKIIDKYKAQGEILKYISRFDYNRNFGWFVRVPDANSKLHTGWFSDGVIDASINAADQIELGLVEAIIYRDNLCQRLGTPLVECVVRRLIKNKTGFYGLNYVDKIEKKFRAGEWRTYRYKSIRATHIAANGKRLINDIVLTSKMDERQAVDILNQWLYERDIEKFGSHIERFVDIR